MKDHPEMVERVAYAIANAIFGIRFLMLQESQQEACLKAARDAIEEMREPTNEMWAALNETDDWPQVIDAALGQ